MRRFTEAGLLPFMLLLFILPFSGTVAFRLLCVALAFIYAMVVWRRSSVPQIPFLPVLLFWGSTVLASLFYAVDPDYSLSEVKNELMYTMMVFIGFFVITSEWRRIRWFLLALTAGAVVLCIAALWMRAQLGLWGESSAYPFGGSAAFAGYLVAVAPMACLLFFLSDDKWLRRLSLALLGLLLIAGYYCLQRIIWPVLFVQVVVALILCGTRFRFGIKRVAGMLILVALATLLALQLTQATRFQAIAQPSTVMNKDGRLFFFPKVVARILETPWSGAGFGRRALSKAHPDLVPPDNLMLWHGHNVVLNYGLSMGLPGMVAILLVFGALLREYLRFWRSGDRRLVMIGVCGIALVLGVFLRNMVNDMFVRDQALLFWALNGMLLGLGCRLSLPTARPAAP
jgi:O-antigen ligase